jgi:hypothetical protein
MRANLEPLSKPSFLGLLRPKANPHPALMELKTAKEILAEYLDGPARKSFAPKKVL